MSNRGFSSIELLAAFSILMLIMITLLPTVYVLKKEERILSQRRTVHSSLHDHLLGVLHTDNFHPSAFQEEIGTFTVHFTFTRQDHLIKGCASWNNAKQMEETSCLYGYPSE